ncbi:hypothetical protein FKW77_008878 [Venturia effusa]|uniref:Yeast cell wall synthesis Kre9/Knh1-like N-terminal domain-containing protein n=1 Tax=Venturia effusa TaxID=50376 RepID=A0A517L046_9PEZI|nr:hypothetical protein FKW77_008878 [Venturia effusa]
MRFSTLLGLTLGVLADAAFFATDSENPIVPIEGVIVAGKPTAIKWQPTTSGPITLMLRSGPAENLDRGVVIAASIPNTGSYLWTPPADLPLKPNYAIQISNDAYPGTQVNYSPQFAISGPAPAVSPISTSTSTSASSTITSSVSSPTSTSSTASASSSTSAASSSITTSSNSSTLATSATMTGTSSTAVASKTSALSKVPGATGAATRLGQGLAVVAGVGALVAGL